MKRHAVFAVFMVAVAALAISITGASSASRPVVSSSIDGSPLVDGMVLSGQVTWTASTDGAVNRVEFLVDGTSEWTDQSAPYQFGGDPGGKLDTSSLSEGTHTLKVKAYVGSGKGSGSGNASALSVKVTIGRASNNPPPPPSSFVVSSSIAGGASLSGSLAWTATASGATVDTVDFLVDGTLKWTEHISPYEFNGDGGKLDTTTLSNGAHTLSVQAHATDGRTATASSQVTVANGATAPASFLVGSSIANGATLSGSLAWTATASGATVSTVDFLVDGTVKWTELTAPYVFNGDGQKLDTTTLSDGAHTLSVQAHAADGRTATATSSVTVANGPATAPPSFGVVSSIADGATLSGSIVWTATPTGDTAVTRIDFLIDGTSKSTDLVSPYQYGGDPTGKLDTTSLTNGQHKLTLTAYGTGGINTTTTSTVTISNVTSSPPPASGDVGNLWIDPNGGSCTRAATAVAFVDATSCGSFAAALSKAQAGDTVLVRCNSGTSCTFAPEELSGDRGSATIMISAASGYTVSFEEPQGSNRYVWLNGLRHVTFKNIGFGHNNAGDSTPNLRIDCSRSVTLVNASGRRFYMFEGNSDFTFKGGDWGGYSSPGEEDSTMGTTGAYGPQRTCSGDSSPQPQKNILFDGVTFHDVFWISSCSVVNGGQCSQWGGSHPDCFEINGYVDGVTIVNSTFFHCGNTMLSLYTDQGDIDNVIVRNSTFRDNAPWSWYGIQWVTTAGFDCSGDQFVNNTYTPNAPNAWYANTPPRFACNTASASTATVVSGNSFQQAPPSSECGVSKSSPYLTKWSNNTYASGSC